MKRLVIFALAASLLSSCRPTGVFTPGPSPTPYSSPTPTPVSAFSPTPTSLPQGPRTILQSASLSLTVESPAIALSRIQGAVLEAGGFVVSASSWSAPGSPGYSSLSARVPPESIPALRRVALGLSTQIQGDSTYSQDVTADYRRLHERLQTVALAENHILQLLIQTNEPELATSLLIVRELLMQERTNVERQLADYQDRATLAAFDVTLNAPAAMIAIE
jgi:hypothetical protein